MRFIGPSGLFPSGLVMEEEIGKTFFIPASGYRMYFNSQLLDVSSYSRCWSGAPYDAVNGYSLTFTSSNVNPTRSTSATVRAGSRCAPSKNKQAMGFIGASVSFPFISLGLSPRGFKLPNRNAFTGFTSDGNSQSSASNIYGDWVGASGEQPAGRNFSTTHSTSDKTFFIPASGYRDNSNSQLYYVSSFGYYWSAAPYDAYGFNLYFGSSHVSPQFINYRTYGFSVRPVQE